MKYFKFYFDPEIMQHDRVYVIGRNASFGFADNNLKHKKNAKEILKTISLVLKNRLINIIDRI